MLLLKELKIEFEKLDKCKTTNVKEEEENDDDDDFDLNKINLKN